jgi:hypothetical protein
MDIMTPAGKRQKHTTRKRDGLVSYKPEQTRDAFAEGLGFGDEAEHKVAFAREIVEVPRMNAHLCVTKKANSQVFVAFHRWYAKDDVPSSFDLQARACWIVDKLTVEFCEVCPQTIEQNGLDHLALIEEHRSCELDGSIH